jgi:uncharacterized membrane protein
LGARGDRSLSRVRLLHQNFIHGILNSRLTVAPGAPWLEELSSDLRHPQYKITLTYALRRRLYANYMSGPGGSIVGTETFLHFPFT